MPLTGQERAKWRSLVTKNPWSFMQAPKEVRADAQIVFQAVNKAGLLLEHAAGNCQSERKIVLEAVKSDVEAFHFAHEKLRSDREIMQTVVRSHPQYLRFASEKLRADSTFVLEAIAELWFTAEYVAEPLRYSVEFWREVIEQDPETGWMAFSYAPPELRSEPSLVMEAIRVDPMAFKFASDELRGDRGFVRKAVKENWAALAYATMAVRSDAKTVLEAAKQDCDALRYASEKLLADPAFTLAAAGHNGRALTLGAVPSEVKADKSFVMEAVTKNADALMYTSAGYQEDRDVVNKAMATRLGACSGLLWSSGEDSMKWARGTVALAQDALKASAAKRSTHRRSGTLPADSLTETLEAVDGVGDDTSPLARDSMRRSMTFAPEQTGDELGAELSTAVAAAVA